MNKNCNCTNSYKYKNECVVCGEPWGDILAPLAPPVANPRKATIHEIKQALFRLNNVCVGTNVQVQYLGKEAIFPIWVFNVKLEIVEMIKVDQYLSLNVTKAILVIKKALKNEQ